MEKPQSKSDENRVRRMAERQGFRAMKSPRRDPRAIDYNLWQLVDVAGRKRQTVGEGYTLSFEDAEAWLQGGEG